jgi:hypothetical protein
MRRACGNPQPVALIISFAAFSHLMIAVGDPDSRSVSGMICVIGETLIISFPESNGGIIATDNENFISELFTICPRPDENHQHRFKSPHLSYFSYLNLVEVQPMGIVHTNCDEANSGMIYEIEETLIISFPEFDGWIIATTPEHCISELFTIPPSPHENDQRRFKCPHLPKVRSRRDKSH